MAEITLEHIACISNTLTEKLVQNCSLATHLQHENNEVVTLLMQLIKTHDAWLQEEIGSSH